MNRPATLLIASILVVVVAGCGDDDNPAATGGANTLVVGNVILRPYIDFHASIYPIYAQDNPVDSVKIGDSLCSIYESYHHVAANDYNYGVVYNNRADSLRFDAGDTVEIELFVGSRTVRTYVKLINSINDTTVYIIPDTGMFAMANQPFDITWHSIENADWYSVTLYFAVDSTPYTNIATYLASSVDTVFTVPADYHVKEGRYTIYVRAVSGPVPGTQEANVSGAGITGSIYSSCADGYGMEAIVNMPPDDVAAKPISFPRQEVSSEEMLRILSRY